MILTDGEIVLQPGAELEYFSELVQKYRFNCYNEYGITKAFGNIKHFWTGSTRGIPGGVLFVHYVPALGRWFFDAYKDDEKLKNLDNRGDFSYKAGRLVINWFFEKGFSPELFTAHETANRGATLVCKRLGFRTEEIKNDFVVMKIGR
jgi:hypothetical protein